jgi:hypothetical protein
MPGEEVQERLTGLGKLQKYNSPYPGIDKVHEMQTREAEGDVR